MACLAGLVVLLACNGAPEAARAVPATTRAEPQPVPTGAELAARLGCGACHAGAPHELAASPLPVRDRDLDPAAILDYLMDPPAPAEGAARMPDFGLTETEAAALALNIAAGEPGSGGGNADRFREIASARTLVEDTVRGTRIRTALRCDACHGGPAEAAAPVLAGIGTRVRSDWLHDFLRSPYVVRPYGWLPGSGTRMPDFSLSDTEVDSLMAWLAPDAAPEVAGEPPGERRRTNTLTLMRERWGCMGCHAWNGTGGRIGPDLALAAERLRPEHVRAMLEDPAAAAPGTIMPKPLLQPDDIDRIVAVLAHNDDAGNAWRQPLSVLDPSIFEPERGTDAAAVYDRTCAGCHGRDGWGGYNTQFMGERAPDHADSTRMSRRPDDTLYDGIAAGGRILGGTGRMPAFGGSLEPETIRALVAHIRTLCSCEGPEWAR